VKAKRSAALAYTIQKLVVEDRKLFIETFHTLQGHSKNGPTETKLVNLRKENLPRYKLFLAVRQEYFRILGSDDYKTKKLAVALEIVTKSNEPAMEPTDQMQLSFTDEEEEHDVLMNDVIFESMSIQAIQGTRHDQIEVQYEQNELGENNDISLADLELPPAELHHQAVMRGALNPMNGVLQEVLNVVVGNQLPNQHEDNHEEHEDVNAEPLAIADEAFMNPENVDPGQQENQVQDDYALFEEFSVAWMNRYKRKENQYKTDLEQKANQLREKDDELREKDVELKDMQIKLLSVTEELGKMKDFVRRTQESNEKERRRRKYYQRKFSCYTEMNQPTPDNYSTDLYDYMLEMIGNYKRNQQQASQTSATASTTSGPTSTSGQPRLKRQRTAGETSSASSSGASSSASSKTCQR
jgi:hypothetical protein